MKATAINAILLRLGGGLNMAARIMPDGISILV